MTTKAPVVTTQPACVDDPKQPCASWASYCTKNSFVKKHCCKTCRGRLDLFDEFFGTFWYLFLKYYTTLFVTESSVEFSRHQLFWWMFFFLIFLRKIFEHEKILMCRENPTQLYFHFLEAVQKEMFVVKYYPWKLLEVVTILIHQDILILEKKRYFFLVQISWWSPLTR